jgi:hypothetical protein
MKNANVGVIGCGRISGQYLENLVRRFPFCLNTAACADIVREAAESRTERPAPFRPGLAVDIIG